MAQLDENDFSRIGRFAGRSTKLTQRLFGPLVERLAPADHNAQADWRSDADWAVLQQEPLRARALLRISAAVIVLLIVWAAFAEIDEVTRGQGKVVPTSQVQIVQSVDGGVVEMIAVKEGQVVEPGQLLFRVDPTRFKSNMMESRTAQLALQAKALRLEALTRGTSFNPPAELLKEVPDVVAQEQRLYESRRESIAAQVSITYNQLTQRQQELNEVRARREQAERSLELLLKEISVTRPMVATGAVSEVEVCAWTVTWPVCAATAIRLARRFCVCKRRFKRPSAELRKRS